jgi:hypothetical protein
MEFGLNVLNLSMRDHYVGQWTRDDMEDERSISALSLLAFVYTASLLSLLFLVLQPLLFSKERMAITGSYCGGSRLSLPG